jgi:hypothetical protein
MKHVLSTLGLLVALASPTVNAQSFFDVVNVSASGRTNGSSNFVSGVGSLDYVVGRLRLNLEPQAQARITYSFENAEAGRGVNNLFFGPSSQSMIGSGAARNTLLTTTVGGGLLDFGFQTAGRSSVVSNSSNYAWNASRVGISLDDDGRSGRLLFEDAAFGSGGMDYDDMVVRFQLNVAPVPEASSLVMLGAGIGLLALMARRYRNVPAGAIAPRV